MLTVLTDPTLVDLDKVKNTIKGVQIALICVIFLTNAAYIISKIGRKGCSVAFFTPQHAIRISLALAGILAALYYNVISAMIVFDTDNHGLSCTTRYLANCYFFTVLPLVYSSGLMLLGLDFVLRFKSVTCYKSLSDWRLCGVVCVLLPWAVALLIACPLTLTEIQWHLKCANTQSNQHTQAVIICCTLLPASFLLLSALVVGTSVRPKRYYDFQRGFEAPMYAINNVTVTSRSDTTDSRINEAETQGSIKSLNGSSSYYSSSGRTSSQIRITSSSSADNAYPSTTHAHSKSISREKCKLLFSMLLLAACVFPYGCIFVYITTEYERMYSTLLFYMVDFQPFIAYLLCSNIMNLFSAVIPLVWLCTQY